MARKNWPERQGDISAIILVDGSEKKMYEVLTQSETSGPWYEGSTFGEAGLSEQKGVDGHYFAYKYYPNGNGESCVEIVGIAHNKSELADKIYACAVAYCRKIARWSKERFIDLTRRGKKKKLKEAMRDAAIELG